MTTNRNLLIACVLACFAAGCGSSNQAVTDPNQLKPLTEAEKAEIKKQDEMIDEEEGASQKVMFPKEKAKK